MTFFTSINNCYLPKARVLAKSIKQFMPDSLFVLILSDKIPDFFNLGEEPFDEIISIEDLGIPVDNLDLWIYLHSIVELCTAVKGQALLNLLEKHEKVVYLDPDIVLFSDLHLLEELLDQYDIIFTPHLTVPEENDKYVIINEICSLNHGVYNFGFFAVKSSKNGKLYAKWYRDRLLKYCKDDKANGLFTDQRWGDLAPAMFNNLYIWKHPGANVCVWNLSHRFVNKHGDKYYSNDEPLLFYHFSGFDSGANSSMLDIFANGNSELYKLNDWYKEEIDKNGQQKYCYCKCFYSQYYDGTFITEEERNLIKNDQDVYSNFLKSNPFQKEGNSYYSWFMNEMKNNKRFYQSKNDILNELNNVYNSRSWRFTAPLRKIAALLRKNHE